jgi:hypothetical protein
MMNRGARRGLPALLLCALLGTLPCPSAAASGSPSGSGPSADDPAPDDKLLHFLAGLAVGLSAGGAFSALDAEAVLRRRPGSVCAAAAAATLLAGTAKETLDARRRQAGRSAEVADAVHTLLGGLAGGALAEALIRAGGALDLQPRWTGIGLAISGGALGFTLLRSGPP